MSTINEDCETLQTTTVLATPDVVDFLYTCDTHLTDPGFATLVPSELAKPQVSLEEIERIKKEYEEKQKGKKEKEEAKKKEAEKEKEKEKDEKKDKGDSKTVAVPKKATSPTATPTPPAPSTPSHQKYTLHRQIFQMRQDEHKKRRQAKEVKEIAPKFPIAPRSNAIFQYPLLSNAIVPACRVTFEETPNHGGASDRDDHPNSGQTFTSDNASTLSAPIDSAKLLTYIVSWSLTAGIQKGSRLRLTEVQLLEDILEEFAERWNYGDLEISWTNDTSGGMAVGNISRVVVTRVQVEEPLRKRKRESSEEPPVSEQLPPVQDAHHISEDLREVYMMLQKGTAKGRLLAEQYRSGPNQSFDPICPHITKDDCIKAQRVQQAQVSPDVSLASSRLPPTPLITHCDKVHFKPLIRPHTDPSLGHCSYLNTCYSEPTYALSPSIPPPSNNPSGARIGNTNAVSLPSGLGAGGRGKEKAPCRYLHFEVDYDAGGGADASGIMPGRRNGNAAAVHQYDDGEGLQIGTGPTGRGLKDQLPPQWINCDVRKFDYSTLGKFHVIMADPPWDIHMSLPYGTMTDDEMRAMPIPALQDEGVIFLWVTGRAMEVGRECLRFWGYTRVDEVVWLKTNQLQRVIRTGRTGHWLNHTKEHMLVGLKTNLDEEGNLKWPKWLNRGLDVDVIVSEVRETSRKPDEVYGLIERMCPGGRKLGTSLTLICELWLTFYPTTEIFGRKHNTRPGWITLGNQLGQDQIYEEDLAQRIQARYPERVIRRPT
ncbi:hypothetical protein FRB90_002345 [Tulasnella sp. 427]|nr:hypothetical protein FRB90_002345 [Tulasnella sp. 427]